MYDITASIVLYNNDLETLKACVNSFLNTNLRIRLFLVDNSPIDKLRRSFSNDPRLEYIFNNSNLGFGRAHNIAIDRTNSVSAYHLILNPDVYFKRGTLEILFEYMNENKA